MPQEPGRVSGDDRIGRYVLRHDSAGADERVLTDRDIGQDRGARSNRGAFADQGSFDLPVRFGLDLPIRRSSGIGIIDKHDTVADEDVIFDVHAFANKGMAGYLAVLADRSILLDLDESSDLAVIADGASI